MSFPRMAVNPQRNTAEWSAINAFVLGEVSEAITCLKNQGR
jgi:hypothetical protein